MTTELHDDHKPSPPLGLGSTEWLGLSSERETIARQAMRLEGMEIENSRLRENIKKAISHIVCIGGPLNDNKLGYSKQQMVTFWRIKEELEA